MRHVAKIAAGLVRTFAQDGNRAAGGLRQSSQRAQQSGLPCSVVAEDDVESAGVELRIHATQCGEATELLHQCLNDDDRKCSRVGHEDWMPGDLAATTRIYGLSPIFAKISIHLERSSRSPETGTPGIQFADPRRYVS